MHILKMHTWVVWQENITLLHARIQKCLSRGVGVQIFDAFQLRSVDDDGVIFQAGSGPPVPLLNLPMGCILSTMSLTHSLISAFVIRFPERIATCSFNILASCCNCAHARIQRGAGSQDPHHRKNHKFIGFLSNTGPEPLKHHKATKPAFNVRPSWALKWCFSGVRIIARL